MFTDFIKIFEDQITGFTLIKYIVLVAFILIKEGLLVSGVYYYNKCCGVKEKRSFYEWIFFFGIFAIIFNHKKFKENSRYFGKANNAKKYKTLLILIIVLYIALFIAYQIIDHTIFNQIVELMPQI